jgi:predicted PurR-regulated permease PerM
VTVSFIAGIVMLIVALVLNLNYSFALGLTVFICGLIPMIGHLLGISIFTIVALTNSTTTAVIAFLAYVIYQQIENYIIMPRIMSKSLSVPGLVTIIAALLGTSLLGLIGALLAVPIAAAILLIVEEVVFPRTDNS